MPRTAPPPAGMTLIELLIAMSIGVAMIAMTWSAFIQARNVTARTTARVNLHLSTSLLQEAMERDLANLAPAVAFFVRSTVANPDATTRQETVEMVFMRSTSPLDKQNAVPGAYDYYLADHHWVRWRFARTLKLDAGLWKVSSGALYRAASTPTRTWKTTAALTVSPSVTDPATATPKSNYAGVRWVNIPRPLRDAATWGIDGLNHNRYGIPAAAIDTTTPIGDIDDLADLDANERLVSNQVRDFAIGLADAGGQVATVSGAAASDLRRNGLYMDVVGPDNGLYPAADIVAPDAAQAQYDYKPDLARRPRVVRVALGMRDADTSVSQDFVFSIATPGLAPPIAQPSP